MERIWLNSYPEGVPSEIDPDAYRSIGEFFAASVEQYRDRDAFVSMGRTMSFGELDHLSRAFASYLRQVAALPVGARIALMMPNILQYPVVLFGALRAGLVVVNCNPLYSPRELHLSSRIPARKRLSSSRISPRRWRRPSPARGFASSSSPASAISSGRPREDGEFRLAPYSPRRSALAPA